MSELNNLEDIFKDYAQDSKEGKKLKAQRGALDEAKEILKTLDMAEAVEVTRPKVEALIKLLYTRNHLITQFKYMNNKRTTQELVQQAYYAVLGKEEQYDKSLKTLRETYELDEG